MSQSQDLLKAVLVAGMSEVKAESGGYVSYNLDSARKIIAFAGSIPVELVILPDGSMKYQAVDFLNLPFSDSATPLTQPALTSAATP